MTATRGSTTAYTILTIDTGDVWRGGFLKRMLSMLLNLSFCTTPVGTRNFPKSGDDVHPKTIDTDYVFLGPCTPADIKSNGYKFVEDSKAISMYNALKRKLK